MRTLSRGRRAILWIENFCLVPDGSDRGKRVRLTPAQRDTIRQIYDNPHLEAVPISGPLAAFIALLHLCGPEALRRDFQPELRADFFTVWNATGPDLRAVLKRDGASVVCPDLGTRWLAA